MDIIPYAKQWIDEEDISAVVNVLKGDWITQGPTIRDFEKKIADYVGAKHAIAFSNGTAALHAAMFAANISNDDEIITTTNTFVASANCAVYLGAKPVLVDIDLSTYCIDIDKIEQAITKKTKTIVPVDFAGYPVNMQLINEMASRNNLVVIEDAAHALGAKRKGKMVGTEADMTMFSFHPVKHITTGEGGIIVTDDEEYDQKMRIFRTHGITKDASSFVKENDGPWYYEMQYLGFNYRITDIQSALGLSQLSKIESFVKRRNEIAKIYDESFSGEDKLTIPPKPRSPGSRHAYHIYPLLVDGVDKKHFYQELRDRNIYCQVHYIPVHFHPYYQQTFGFKIGDFPVVEDYYQKELTIPLYPKMSSDEIDYVINTIKDALG
jgi:UDP-4-amino-4,6-dideoxy-N-acetyl-beta-L-altrosamine transaminase